MSNLREASIVGVCIFLFSNGALGQIEVPHTFTAGERALAAEVNENFDVLAEAIQSLRQSTNVKWMGNWQNGVSYAVDDLVHFQGSAYLAVQATTGVEDPTNSAFWSLFASQGAAGSTGPQGQVGPQGAQGIAGPAGPQGAVGVAGPQGAVGATGSQGPQGADGPQGLQGPEGPQGPAGPPGSSAPNLVIKDGNGMTVGQIVYLSPYGQFAVLPEGIIAVNTDDFTNVSPTNAVWRGTDLMSYFEVEGLWNNSLVDGCGDFLTAVDTTYNGTNSGNGFRLGSWFFRNSVILPVDGRYYHVTGNTSQTFTVTGRLSDSACIAATSPYNGQGLEVVEITLPYTTLTVAIE